MPRKRRSSFGFRKSYKVGGGFRVNVSKKGLGASWGVKGLRVSTGPKGTYLNAGKGGFYYRRKLASPPPTYHKSTQGSNLSFGCSTMSIAVVVFSIASSFNV
jgi:Protein of unknown function (DUF4236)